MLIDLLKEQAEILGFVFVNGDEYTVNLFDEFVNKNHPVFIYYHNQPINDEHNKYGSHISRTYTISILLANSSDYNESIGTETGGRFENGKYKKNVEPLYPLLDELKQKIIGCSELEILNWQIKEVYNLLDYNFDGLFIDAQIKENV